jgi:hypothetical protein
MSLKRLGLLDPGHVAEINRVVYDRVIRSALFISWHYAAGSAYDTPFWRAARSGYEKQVGDGPDRDVVDDFLRYQEKAGRVALGAAPYAETYFGPFTLESGIQMGTGLGLLPVLTAS